jgi:DNA-binding response OmpR family regulator
MATIVVADDEHAILGAVAEVLAMEGHTVIAAADGGEAKGLLGETLPDLVISDMMMPRLDGLGLVRWMRSQPELAHVPVLIVSAAGPPVFNGLESVSYLAKPFTLDALLYEVTQALGETPP